jgi:hypothetical protein
MVETKQVKREIEKACQTGFFSHKQRLYVAYLLGCWALLGGNG